MTQFSKIFSKRLLYLNGSMDTNINQLGNDTCYSHESFNAVSEGIGLKTCVKFDLKIIREGVGLVCAYTTTCL